LGQARNAHDDLLQRSLQVDQGGAEREPHLDALPFGPRFQHIVHDAVPSRSFWQAWMTAITPAPKSRWYGTQMFLMMLSASLIPSVWNNRRSISCVGWPAVCWITRS